MNEDLYWIWISRMQTLSFESFDLLIKKYRSVKNIWNLSVNELSSNTFCNVDLIKNIFCKQYRQNLNSYRNYICKHNISIINCYDRKYPVKLNFIENKPIVLYTMGNIENINNESAAIVGSRICTRYGMQNAKFFSMELSRRGVNIVSGLARGIDAIAHKSCIESGGKTIAVVGHRLRYNLS